MGVCVGRTGMGQREHLKKILLHSARHLKERLESVSSGNLIQSVSQASSQSGGQSGKHAGRQAGRNTQFGLFVVAAYTYEQWGTMLRHEQ